MHVDGIVEIQMYRALMQRRISIIRSKMKFFCGDYYLFLKNFLLKRWKFNDFSLLEQLFLVLITSQCSFQNVNLIYDLNFFKGSHNPLSTPFLQQLKEKEAIQFPPLSLWYMPSEDGIRKRNGKRKTRVTHKKMIYASSLYSMAPFSIGYLFLQTPPKTDLLSSPPPDSLDFHIPFFICVCMFVPVASTARHYLTITPILSSITLGPICIWRIHMHLENSQH